MLRSAVLKGVEMKIISGKRFYTTRETRRASGVDWATLARWRKFLMDAGLCFKASAKPTAPIFYNECCVNFLRKRKREDITTLPDDPTIIARILASWNEKRPEEIAADLGVPTELVLSWASEFFEEGGEKNATI